jgi:nitrate/nitrite-specific signal transduction histidine kinase
MKRWTPPKFLDGNYLILPSCVVDENAVGNPGTEASPWRIPWKTDTERHGTVFLHVRDDGKDFDSNAAGRQGKCLRLDIMHYRTQLIGAWLTIDSRPGAGTTVR